MTALVVAVPILCAAAGGASAADARGVRVLRADGGWMKDPAGRAVLLRGVNLDVGLRHPATDGDLSTPALEDHARTIRRLGFNVVRLQLTWGGMEPGTAGPNDPAICGPGPPSDPGQWDEVHAQRYLDRVDRVVRVMRRHGVSTLFQIAQYAYNERFGGPPSHPDWAVCTGAVPLTSGPGPSAYLQPGQSIAAEHFWNNDVRGDLQGEYQRMLQTLARRFAGDRAVAGFELYNEPFAAFGAVPDGRFDGLVQCFYMGSRDPGRLADGTRPDCPAGVPSEGAVPRIRAVDPDHMLHPQAPIYTNFGVETQMGPLPAGNLAFNFHVYCASGLGVQTVPDGVRGPECETTERRAFDEAEQTRRQMASAEQPLALPGFLSEFGFGDNEAMLRYLTTLADRHLLGWTYFTWRNHEGGDNEGIVRNGDGSLRPKARLLARPYPAALAGTPVAMTYDADTRAFDLVYQPRRVRRDAPTVVVLPALAYGADGACPSVEGASWRIVADRLLLYAVAGARRVAVTVSPGRCGSQSLAQRLRLTVRPSTVTTGRRVRLRFRVTAGAGAHRRAVRRARVTFRGHRTLTDRRGRAVVTARLRHKGRHHARASHAGYAPARARITSVRPSR